MRRFSLKDKQIWKKETLEARSVALIKLTKSITLVQNSNKLSLEQKDYYLERIFLQRKWLVRKIRRTEKSF